MHKLTICAALAVAVTLALPAGATLSSTATSVTYTGNGATTAYTVTFKFLSNSDLVVTVAGVTKTLTTHYTVTGAGNATGTVTFVTAPANAAAVVISRSVDGGNYKQISSIRNSRTYDPSTIENMVDKVTMEAQELKAITTSPPASVLPANVTAKLNGIRFADQFANIQAAITDAGTTGAVLIPSSYAGVDTFTNPNGIDILDLRIGKGVTLPYVPAGTGAVTRTVQSKLSDVVSVKDFGAVGDSVTDDTSAVKAARAAAQVAGKMLYVPAGTYLIGCGTGGSLDYGTLAAPYTLVLRGEGQARSIFKCRTAGTAIQFATQVGNNFSNGIEIGDIGLTGFGSSDGTVAHGIADNDVDNGTSNIDLHDLLISGFSGHGVYLPAEFSVRIQSVYVNDCGDDLFDVQGGNTTTLINTYAQTVAAGHAGYRIHNGGTLISANGINNTWGATSGTGLSEDQADWGVFGNESLTAWAQTTAYTVGQQRQANGMEFEVITNGTSSGAGVGPASISKDITDGTVHWRHIGKSDANNRFARMALINCNIEDATRTGIRLKNSSTVDLIGSGFIPPPGAGAASPGLIALWYSNALDAQQAPSFIDGFAFIATFTAYDHASPIHTSSGGASFVRFGGTTNNPIIWSRTTTFAISNPAITIANNGQTGASTIYQAISIPRLYVNGGPLTLSRVTPTYGASVVVNQNIGNLFDITATDGTAFTIQKPGNSGTANGAAAGMRITFRIINASGGALGVITWDGAYKMTAFTNPADGFNRSIEFIYDGTNWNEINRGAADVPN